MGGSEGRGVGESVRDGSGSGSFTMRRGLPVTRTGSGLHARCILHWGREEDNPSLELSRATGSHTMPGQAPRGDEPRVRLALLLKWRDELRPIPAVSDATRISRAVNPRPPVRLARPTECGDVLMLARRQRRRLFDADHVVFESEHAAECAAFMRQPAIQPTAQILESVPGSLFQPCEAADTSETAMRVTRVRFPSPAPYSNREMLRTGFTLYASRPHFSPAARRPADHRRDTEWRGGFLLP